MRASAVASCGECFDGFAVESGSPWEVSNALEAWIESHASGCAGPVSSISWQEPELFAEGSPSP